MILKRKKKSVDRQRLPTAITNSATVADACAISFRGEERATRYTSALFCMEVEICPSIVNITYFPETFIGLLTMTTSWDFHSIWLIMRRRLWTVIRILTCTNNLIPSHNHSNLHLNKTKAQKTIKLFEYNSGPSSMHHCLLPVDDILISCLRPMLYIRKFLTEPVLARLHIRGC